MQHSHSSQDKPAGVPLHKLTSMLRGNTSGRARDKNAATKPGNSITVRSFVQARGHKRKTVASRHLSTVLSKRNVTAAASAPSASSQRVKKYDPSTTASPTHDSNCLLTSQLHSALHNLNRIVTVASQDTRFDQLVAIRRSTLLSPYELLVVSPANGTFILHSATDISSLVTKQLKATTRVAINSKYTITLGSTNKNKNLQGANLQWCLKWEFYNI